MRLHFIIVIIAVFYFHSKTFCQIKDSAYVNELVQKAQNGLNNDSIKALELFDKALETALSINYIKGQVLSLYGKSKYFSYRSDFKNAILYAKQALTLQRRENNNLMQMKLLYNIGAYYHYLENYDLALRYYGECLIMSEKEGDTLIYPAVKLNTALVYVSQREITIADSLLGSTINQFEDTWRPSFNASAYTNYAKVKSYLGSFKEAKSLLNKAIYYQLLSGDSFNIYLSYFELSCIMYELNDLDSTIILASQAKEYFIKNGNDENIFFTNVILCQAYLKKGDSSKGINLLEEALQWFKNIKGTKQLEIFAFERLAQIYSALGNKDQQIFYLNKLSISKDSLYTFANKKATQLLREELKLKEKEFEINQLKTASEIERLKHVNERSQLLLLSLFLISSIGFVFILYRRKVEKQKMSLKKEKIESDRLKLKKEKELNELEKRFLGSQMNPHFIFNSLNSIKSFVLSNQGDLASKYLTDFSKLMRLILEASRKEQIPIEKEIAISKYYLQLERYRLNNSFDFEIIKSNAFEEEIEEIEILPMLIQPFVENAIQHGIQNIDYKGKIVLSLDSEREYVRITISDNGVGIKNSHGNTHNSLATQITLERIANFNKSNRGQIQLEISNLDPGTQVKFTIKW
jgi:sensor histidine kinase YesM